MHSLPPRSGPFLTDLTLTLLLQIPADECAQYPSQVNITNVVFENFTGTSSGKNGAAVAKLTCSTNPAAVCEGIVMRGFNITSPCTDGDGNTVKPVVICDGIQGSIGDGGENAACVPSNSPEASAALAATCTSPLATISPPF